MESEPARLMAFWIMVLERETRLWKEGNHALIPINHFKFGSKKGKRSGAPCRFRVCSLQLPPPVARNNFQVWDAKKLWGHVPWSGLHTQSQQVRSKKWSQLILRHTVSLGPRQKLGGRQWECREKPSMLKYQQHQFAHMEPRWITAVLLG